MKKNFFLKRAILFLLASFLFFESVLSEQVLAEPLEFKFQSQVKNYYLNVGEKVPIKANALFSNGRTITLSKDFKAKVKDSKVAKLKGYELTGITNGQTILELSYSGKKFTANIFVGDKKPETAQVVLDPEKEKEGKKVPAVFYTRNNGTVTLEWKKQKDIKNYSVFRSSKKDGSFKELIKGIVSIKFVDKNVKNEDIYYYKVIAYDNKKKAYESLIMEVPPFIPKAKFDPKADNDKDGLSNEEELILATDMNKKDSDNDGVDDKAQVKKEKDKKAKEDDSPKYSECPVNQKDVKFSNGKMKASYETVDEKVKVSIEGNSDIKEADFKVHDINDEFLNSIDGIVGKPVDFSLGSPFDKAIITFNYSDDSIKNIDEKNLGIYYVNEEKKCLVPLKDSKVDIFNNTISASTSHFSTYVLGDNRILGRKITTVT